MAAFAAGSLLPGVAQGQVVTPTYDLVLTGKVRDFPSSHPDFCQPPTFGQNWVEGAVAPQLDGNGRPVWQGGGKRVTVPARDAVGNVISDSLIDQTVLLPPQGLKLVGAPTLINNPTLDTYNPALGFYGAGNIGPAPQVSTGQTMPAVVVPSVGTYIAAPTYNGTVTISTSFRCNDLVLHQDTLEIEGDVTIIVEDVFDVGNSSHIELRPGARLSLYLLSTALLSATTIENHCSINMNSGDHTRCTIYKLGTSDFNIENHTSVCATIISPNAEVHCQNNSDVYGTVTAKTVYLKDPTSLHIAETAQTQCSNVNDTPAQLGPADPAAVGSPQTFGQWFDNVPGVNMDAQARLLFQKDASGALEFSTNDFHPIDGKLLDQGAYGANRNFTMEMDGEFYYTPCTGQFFNFFGDGDAYVYIDGKLVMEMAGNNVGVAQHVDFDRLGLSAGETHKLKFFYAQRSCGASRFSVRTNVELMTKYVVEVETIALLD